MSPLSLRHDGFRSVRVFERIGGQINDSGLPELQETPPWVKIFRRVLE